MSVRTIIVLCLLVAVMLAGCSKAGKDSDGDGLTDAFEKRGWLVRVDYLRERVEYRAFSDENSDDGDGDGLPDSEEYFLRFDPSKSDTDDDGLTDCQELTHTDKEQCEDTAYEGEPDGGFDTDPLKADSDPVGGRFVRRSEWFTDKTASLPDGLPDSGDGIPDGDEINGYDLELRRGVVRHITTGARDGDSDDDGLGDGEERFLFASDPTVADTDGDGCDDGSDAWPDRTEQVDPHPLSFQLSPNHPGPVQLRLQILLVDVLVLVPPSGSRSVSPGETVNLTSYASQVRPECLYPPHEPATRIQLLAQDMQPGGFGFLDITSSNPGGSDTWMWNLRDDAMTWMDGSPLNHPAILSGLDGSVSLDPRVL